MRSNSVDDTFSNIKLVVCLELQTNASCRYNKQVGVRVVCCRTHCVFQLPRNAHVRAIGVSRECAPHLTVLPCPGNGTKSALIQDRPPLLSPPILLLRAHSPQDAFYILQNSKSMMLRFRQQCKTAQAVAEMLQSHIKVLSP